VRQRLKQNRELKVMWKKPEVVALPIKANQMILSENNLSSLTQLRSRNSDDASLRSSRQSIQARMVHRRGVPGVLAGASGGWAGFFKSALHFGKTKESAQTFQFQMPGKLQTPNFKCFHMVLFSNVKRSLPFGRLSGIWNSRFFPHFIPIESREIFIGRGLLSEHLPKFFPRCHRSLGVAGSQHSTVRQRVFSFSRTLMVAHQILWQQQRQIQN
jgi:hypothetical protein